MVSWSGSSLFYILTEEKLPLTRLNDSQGEAGISPQVTSITSGSWVEYLCSQAVMASRSHGGILVTLQHNCTVDNRRKDKDNFYFFLLFGKKPPNFPDRQYLTSWTPGNFSAPNSQYCFTLTLHYSPRLEERPRERFSRKASLTL